MLLIFLLLTVTGVILTTMLARRRSRHTVTAAVSTGLLIFAIVSGFSIGIYIAPVAVALLALSVAYG